MRTFMMTSALVYAAKGSAGAAVKEDDSVKDDASGKNETTSQRALATVNAPVGFKIEGMEFEFEEQLTRGVLAQQDDKPYAVKITGPIHEAPGESTGKQERKVPRKTKGPDGKPFTPEQQAEADAAREVELQKLADGKKPPNICDVTNLVTGELQVLVVNASLQDVLEEKFPNDSYIGNCFAFKSKLMPTRDPSKKFRLYDLHKIKEPKSVLNQTGEKAESEGKLA